MGRTRSTTRFSPSRRISGTACRASGQASRSSPTARICPTIPARRIASPPTRRTFPIHGRQLPEDRIHPRAGQPADPAHLVDLGKLIDAYSTRRPDPGVAAQRVAFGTSGHRGSSFTASFNDAHVLAITQAICLYRRSRDIDGAAVHRHRHPCAVAAGVGQRARGARGERCRGDDLARRRVHADAGGVARDHRLTIAGARTGWPTAS